MQKEQGVYRDFRRQYDFLSMRLTLPESRLARIPIIGAHISDYFVCAMGFMSMAKDLFLPKPLGIEHWTPASAMTSETGAGSDVGDGHNNDAGRLNMPYGLP